MKKFSKSELVRLALLYAIQDRDGYAECDSQEAGKRAAELAAHFRKYLMERYGEEPLGDILDRGPTVSLHDIPLSSQDGEGG